MENRDGLNNYVLVIGIYTHDSSTSCVEGGRT